MGLKGESPRFGRGFGSGIRRIITVLGLGIFASFLGVPPGMDSPTAQERIRPPAAAFAADEIIIRYSRLSGEEVVGLGIATEHAEVAALALKGLNLPTEKLRIDPLYPEVFDEMRSTGLNENLAILSLVKKYEPSSKRFLESTFFAQLQDRRSRYGFSRGFTVRFDSPQNIQGVVDGINKDRRAFRSKGFFITASPVQLSPVVGNRVDAESTIRPEQVPACSSASVRVAIIGDQFTQRTDLPRLTQISMMSSQASGCDATPYERGSESHGTNLAGVVSGFCPTCPVLGFDAGCAREGKNIVRTTEGVRAALGAILRDAAVVFLTTADTKSDPVYDDILFAASSAGVVVVAPAGDGSAKSAHYPAATKGVIGVAANDISGALAEFSNTGTWVTTSARGAEVSTTHGEGGFRSLSSTSLAAARVTGLIARYLALNPTTAPSSILVQAGAGAFSSEPNAQECSGTGGRDGGSNSSGGNGAGGTSGGSSSSGTGEGRGGDGGGSSSSAGGDGSSGGGTGGSGSNAGGGGSNSSEGGGSATLVNSLATLEAPSSVKTEALGRSPFAQQKVWALLNSQQVKTGEASSNSGSSVYITSSPKTRVEVVYLSDSPAAEYVDKYRDKGSQPIPLGAGTNELWATLLVDQGFDINKQLAAIKGVIGVYATDAPPSQPSNTVVAASEVSASSVNTDNSAALAEMGWNDGVKEFADKLTAKVKVAVISTGLDYEGSSFQGSVTKDLRVTDASGVGSGDFPRDTDGFGTQVASLLGHESYGIARNFIELIPIKVFADPSNPKNWERFVIQGIAFAVNKGAEVIVLPHDFNTLGCNPVVGHAIYKAREKGAVFAIAAGDGLLNEAKTKVGYPVVAARDDGPASYEMTSTPACWSRYFLGAMSFAASEGFAKPLPQFANYGDDIELSAIGANLATASLRNRVTAARGSAFSAAWGAAAAAMAIAHHKTHQLRYGAWYIENLLVESAKRDPNALGTVRRNRFGSLLNFASLQRLLVSTESMTDDERRNNIRTINPRQGDGWKPGEDKSNLRYVALTLSKTVAKPGEELSYKVIAFFRSGEDRDVTGDTVNTAISLQSIQGKEYLTLVRPGVIKVADAEAFKFFKGTPTFAVSANFNHEQAQGFDSAAFRVALKPEERTLQELEIIAPNTPLRIGQDINFFGLKAKYVDATGAKTEEMATGAATWRSSHPEELRISASPGIIDARDAVSGKSCTIFADFEGKTAQLTVVVEPEQLRQFYIHSYLGQGGKIERGQIAVLESRMILRGLAKDREQMMDAAWFQGSTQLNGGARSRSLAVDTSKLAPGTYTFTAKGLFKSVEGAREVTASIQLTVVTDIKYIEIHLKTPIVQVGQPFFIDLRAYRFNNSYVVVTEDAEWSTDAPTFVTINRYGVGFVREGFDPRTVTVTARYKGHIAKINLAVILGSVVTGSSSNIDYLTMRIDLPSRWDKYCRFPGVGVTAKYKDGQERNVAYRSVSFAEQRPDGSWGDANLPLYGGRKYRASAAYNDGSQAAGGGGASSLSTTFVMPKEKLDSIQFNVRDRDVPDEIFRGASSRTEFDSSGVCSLVATQVAPVTQTMARFSGTRVWVSPGSLGVHKVAAQGFYTGMGLREEKWGYFTVEVKDTVPVRIMLRMTSESENAIARTEQGYGSKVYWVSLHDKDNRRVRFIRGDIDIAFKHNGSIVDSKINERIWLEPIANLQAMEEILTLSMHAYPRSLGERLELVVTHKPTGLSTTRSFTDIGSWEASDTQALNLPSEEPPTPNTSVHPSCIEYAKAPTGLEFAGGSGTDTDPVVICNATQLMLYGRGFLFSDTQYCKTTKKCRGIPNPDRAGQTLYIALLGDSIDFKGARVSPIEFQWVHDAHRFDGGMRGISNYVIVDSEKQSQGLFSSSSGTPHLELRNLVVTNPVVRGDSYVAALYAGLGPIKLVNVSVIGGAVWGKNSVGGVATAGSNLENIKAFGTEVRYEGFRAGGVAVSVNGGSKLLFTGSVAPAGVPGQTEYIGGVAGVMSGRVTDVLMTGRVITLNAFSRSTSVGGIAGASAGNTLINAVMRGNVVSTGAGVGGIVGSFGRGAFGLDPLKPYTRGNVDLLRPSAIIGARVEGNIWGGMSRKELECIDKVAQILGVGGSTNCIGDIKSQKGGRSDVGGIVGVNSGGLIQDSVFAGTVRGVSAVGGISGYDKDVSNYVRNTSKGVVSASEGVSEYGALIGLSESLRASDRTYKGRVVSRFDGNTIVAGEGNPAWAIGRLDNEIASPMTSNVPEYYSR
jgi:hypothetical protein